MILGKERKYKLLESPCKKSLNHFSETRLNLQSNTHCVKGVSDLETSMNYFALPGRSLKNLIFIFPSKQPSIQNFFERLLDLSQQSFLNEKCAVKFKCSQLLPGSVKESIHITKVRSSYGLLV